MNPKQRAAQAALDHIRSDSVIGLGTGSTAELFLDALAEALKAGRLRNIRGVPTSLRSDQRARELGIPLTTLAQTPQLDLTIDGADEVAPNLDLIKGLGGALMREKIVAQNSMRLLIIVDSSKRVDVLGRRSPLPVEVATFAHESQERFLKDLGCIPTLRSGGDGKPFLTDNGNYIYDCKFDSIPEPDVIESALARRAGIVEWGLFLGMASLVLVGDDAGVQVMHAAP